jgi:hypothetical protein
MRKMEIQGTSAGKLLAAAVIAVVGAGSANADNWTINLRASAGEVCHLRETGNFDAIFEPGDLVGEDAKVKTLTREVFRIDPAYCNYPIDVRLTSTNHALLDPAQAGRTPPEGMTNMIKYQATLTWGSSFTIDGSNDFTEIEGRGPINAPLTISIKPMAETKILIQGTYSDTLTLSIGVGI